MPGPLFQSALEHHRAGRLAEAEAIYRQLLAQNPRDADALDRLGVLARQCGDYETAVELLNRAVGLRPGSWEFFYHLGIAQTARRDLDAAATAYRRAIELKGDHLHALTNLGAVLKDQGKIDEAISMTRRALEIDPLPLIWSNLLLFVNFHPGYDEAAIAREYRRWEERCVARHTPRLALPQPPPRRDRDPERRLRVGYLADFRRHPATAALLPILLAHDRRAFELFAYGDAAEPDDMTERVTHGVDAFRDISRQSNEQAAQTIANDRIDILIEAIGHSASGHLHSRMLLMAARLAPILVSYGAYPASSGLSAIDYRITDRFLDRVESPQLKRISSFWCYPLDDDDLPVGEPPLRRNGYVTFGSLNAPMKVSPQVIALWSRLLAAAPGSKLRLMSLDRSARYAGWIEEFARHGIAADRLEWAERVPSREYLQSYGSIDIAIDPFPWGGHMTSCDALWMGVPLVTLAGRTSVGRAGVSLLSNLGLTELIARTEDEYVEIAARLAGDAARMNELRGGLRARMKSSVICDVGGLTLQIEAHLRAMWRQHCAAGS
jgi:predicted O-linked N-acetylglucosamine transferase (SPINDLY family)